MRILLSIILLVGLSGCQPHDNLGDGFYVTYVNRPEFRGVYYDHQNVHSGGISVGEVFYNDSIILYFGHPFLKEKNSSDTSITYKTNTPDTTITLCYLIDKQAYKKNPDQLKSNGQSGPISSTEATMLVNGLKKLKHLKWDAAN